MTDELTTDDFMDAYLAHFGKKGMRWGIRNDGQPGSSRGPASRGTNRTTTSTFTPPRRAAANAAAARAGVKRTSADKSWDFAPPTLKNPKDGTRYEGPRYNRKDGTKIGISARDWTTVKRGGPLGLKPNMEAFQRGVAKDKTWPKRIHEIGVRATMPILNPAYVAAVSLTLASPGRRAANRMVSEHANTPLLQAQREQRARQKAAAKAKT